VGSTGETLLVPVGNGRARYGYSAKSGGHGTKSEKEGKEEILYYDCPKFAIPQEKRITPELLLAFLVPAA